MQKNLKDMMAGKFKLFKPASNTMNKAITVEDPDEQLERSPSQASIKIDDFVKNCFHALQLDQDKDEISRLKCAQLFYELMLGHQYGKDWDDK